MATEAQYKFFEKLYDEENKRYTELEARAKFYLSIATIFLGVIALKADDITKLAKLFGVELWVVLAAAIPFALSLLFVVLATTIRHYESAADPEDLIKGQYAGTLPEDPEFRDDRIADYAVAVTRNGRVNDNVATCLSLASLGLGAGVIAQIALLGCAALNGTPTAAAPAAPACVPVCVAPNAATAPK